MHLPLCLSINLFLYLYLSLALCLSLSLSLAAPLFPHQPLAPLSFSILFSFFITLCLSLPQIS